MKEAALAPARRLEQAQVALAAAQDKAGPQPWEAARVAQPPAGAAMLVGAAMLAQAATRAQRAALVLLAQQAPAAQAAKPACGSR